MNYDVGTLSYILDERGMSLSKDSSHIQLHDMYIQKLVGNGIVPVEYYDKYALSNLVSMNRVPFKGESLLVVMVRGQKWRKVSNTVISPPSWWGEAANFSMYKKLRKMHWSASTYGSLVYYYTDTHSVFKGAPSILLIEKVAQGSYCVYVMDISLQKLMFRYSISGITGRSSARSAECFVQNVIWDIQKSCNVLDCTSNGKYACVVVPPMTGIMFFDSYICLYANVEDYYRALNDRIKAFNM